MLKTNFVSVFWEAEFYFISDRATQLSLAIAAGCDIVLTLWDTDDGTLNAARTPSVASLQVHSADVETFPFFFLSVPTSSRGSSPPSPHPTSLSPFLALYLSLSFFLSLPLPLSPRYPWPIGARSARFLWLPLAVSAWWMKRQHEAEGEGGVRTPSLGRSTDL